MISKHSNAQSFSNISRLIDTSQLIVRNHVDPQYNVTAGNPHCPNQEIQNTALKISKIQTIGKLHWLPSKGESVHNYKNTLINRKTQMTESKFWAKIFKHFIK